MKLLPTLVNNPKLRWKYWSVRIQLFFVIAIGAYALLPEAEQLVIQEYMSYVWLTPKLLVLIGFVTAVITQFIQQEKLLPKNDKEVSGD